MKRSGVVCAAALTVISVLTVWSLPSRVHASNLTVTIPAPPYDIIATDKGFHEIQIADYGKRLIPGEPMLPVRSYMIALPPGAEAERVELHPGPATELDGAYRIEASPPFMVLSADAEALRESMARWTQNRDRAFADDALYPSEPGRVGGAGALRQYRYVRVEFAPFGYQASLGKLLYYPSLTVSVDYHISAPGRSSAPVGRSTEELAASLLVNYDQAQEWYAPVESARLAGDAYDYVVITSPALESSLASFVAWKTSLGHSVYVATVDWIQATYAGSDVQEQARNFLIDKYLAWGIKYVLIAGHIDILPMRKCYPDSTNHGGDDGFCPPTDFYYADLTGNWDSDGDGYFGEYGQDSVDFMPEVIVGRIPWSSPAEVAKICQKFVAYEAETAAWKHNALLLGAFAWFENQDYSGVPVTDMANLEEAIADGVLSGWNVTKMYEEAGLCPSVYAHDMPLTTENAINSWTAGPFGMVNWGAHGAPTLNARTFWAWDDGDGVPEHGTPSEIDQAVLMWAGYAPSLDDSHPSIVWATSCNNGYPEELSVGREFIRNGAVAVISASRSAWYTGGVFQKDRGLCGSMNYYFCENLVLRNQTIGDAHFNSAIHYVTHFMSDHYAHYQDLFDFNLYGDPGQAWRGVGYTCLDSDGDGYGDADHPENSCAADNCSGVYNPNQEDFDGDGFGDLCDLCAGVATTENLAYVTGDANNDGSHTSADVIEMVSYIFKSGSAPEAGAAFCDTNCDKLVTSADIIHLVNFVFKGGPTPGDVCAMYME